MVSVINKYYVIESYSDYCLLSILTCGFSFLFRKKLDNVSISYENEPICVLRCRVCILPRVIKTNFSTAETDLRCNSRNCGQRNCTGELLELDSPQSSSEVPRKLCRGNCVVGLLFIWYTRFSYIWLVFKQRCIFIPRLFEM